MTKARITKPINPKAKRPTQCRNPDCGEWFDLIGARSAIHCETCRQKREERMSRAAEEQRRYAEEDAQTAPENRLERKDEEC